MHAIEIADSHRHRFKLGGFLQGTGDSHLFSDSMVRVSDSTLWVPDLKLWQRHLELKAIVGQTNIRRKAGFSLGMGQIVADVGKKGALRRQFVHRFETLRDS